MIHVSPLTHQTVIEVIMLRTRFGRTEYGFHDVFPGRLYWSSGTSDHENVFAGLLNWPAWTCPHLAECFGVVVAPPALATASSVLRTCSSGEGG